MLTRSSIHVDSVRRRATSYFPREYDQPTKYRPALNVKKLVKSLKTLIRKKEAATSSSTSSYKRPASPTSVENTPKRQKRSSSRLDDSAMSEGSNGSINGELDDEANDGGLDAEDSDDADRSPENWEGGWGKYPYAFVYPLISYKDNGFLQEENIHRFGDDQRPIPVFHHSFELHYTKDVPDEDEKEFVDDQTAKKRGWDREEDELMNLLKQISVSAQEPTSIELGQLWLRQYQGRYVGLSEAPGFPGEEYGDSAQAESDKWFLVVPSIPWPNEVDFDADDYTESEIHGDMLAACIVLGSMGRVAIRTNLRIVVPPASGHDVSKHELPFSLRVDITLSLVVPKIYEPIWSRNLTKRDLARQEDAQRRLLSLLFPSSPRDMPTVPHQSDTGSTNIPFLYSILTAAPRLRSEEAMQPDALLPTLLPFQRRSVGWMLEREGKTINSGGEIVHKTSVSNLDNSILPLFWDKVEHDGDDVWYINRLTGTLSSEIPDEDCPPGGILAEEPGLGKTLECIALILLNPAPGRNPTISRWDSGANITLKEIKVFYYSFVVEARR
jgi:E3 ubiquitin-protein ligase SHPRH